MTFWHCSSFMKWCANFVLWWLEINQLQVQILCRTEENSTANFSIPHLFLSLWTQRVWPFKKLPPPTFCLCPISSQTNWEGKLNALKTSLIPYPFILVFQWFIEHLLCTNHCMRHKEYKVEHGQQKHNSCPHGVYSLKSTLIKYI